MSNSPFDVLLFALVPAGLASLGGLGAAFRLPGPRARSFLQHFAAGVVFSVVGVEIPPDIMRVHAPARRHASRRPGPLCKRSLSARR